VDHTLRISKYLCEQFSLNKDGRPIAAKRKRAKK
jgi:hypothetical protein